MLVLQAGKPDPVFPPRWAEQGAVGWAELLVVLLRLAEPPGLRAGPLAHPQSAQPEPDRIGARLVAGLRALLSDEAELDRM